MNLTGLWPGRVVSYDAAARTCRVSIDGVTDGSDTLPEAVFLNPLGDNAATTELRILPDDPVWLMFEAGDARFPIIMGYRTPRAGNPTGTRRWQHANIELIGDTSVKIIVGGTTLTITNGLVAITGASLTVDQNITANLDVADQGGAKTMAGMRGAYNGHKHPETGAITSTPDTGM